MLFGLFGKKSAVPSAVINAVDAAQLALWIKQGTALVIDVREANEFRAGHIPGAILQPLSAFDPAKVPVDPDKHLVFHCLSGRRCGPASKKMAAAGFQGEIFRLSGGFAAWRSAGGAVEN